MPFEVPEPQGGEDGPDVSQQGIGMLLYCNVVTARGFSYLGLEAFVSDITLL